MKIGFVSPYAWDVPGGVQAHIRDLALHYQSLGHQVSVLAPASQESEISEDFVVSAGRPVAIPYNGAVARVLFGPVAASRVRQWISKNDFDVLHLHEPAIPSLSLLACSIADGPMVGTFHAAAPRQKVAFAIAPILEPIIEKLRARIAVSEVARETLRIHLDTDALVIPNGIDVDYFRSALPRPEWSKNRSIGFIGRFSEPRKGLPVLLQALPLIARKYPDLSLFIVGPGEGLEQMQSVPPELRTRITFLGRLDDAAKAEFLRSVEIYVAPNTGGESFGIILAEAMAAGAAIVASDLPAFQRVLGDGLYGRLFQSEDPASLAREIIALMDREDERKRLSVLAQDASMHYDWSRVGESIMNVYLHAIGDGEKVVVSSEGRGLSKLFGRATDD